MRRLLSSVLVASLGLVMAHACGGPFGKVIAPIYDGGPLGLPVPDGGDGGADAGDGGPDAGDAGPDGGCVQGLFNAGGTVIDGCFANTGQPQPLTVVETAGCNEFLSWSSGGTCNGVISGPNNAFDGHCSGFGTCTAPSLPGTISCDGGATLCTIRVCTGSSCP